MNQNIYNKEDQNKIPVIKVHGPFVISKKGISTTTNVNVPLSQREFNQKINEGFTGIEIGNIHSKLWQSVPSQIKDDIARLSKINDIQLSIHAPISDCQISGIGQNSVSEEMRKKATYKLYDVIRDAGEMAKIYGDEIKVNVHASDIPAREWDKKWEDTVKEYLSKNWNSVKPILEKILNKRLEKPEDVPSWIFAKRDVGVLIENPDTKEGRIVPIEAEYYYDPFEKKYKIKTVGEKLKELNDQIWNQYLEKLIYESRSIVSKIDQINKILSSSKKHLMFDPNYIGIFYSISESLISDLNQISSKLNTTIRYLEVDERINQDPKYKKKLEVLHKKLEELSQLHKKAIELKENIKNLEPHIVNIRSKEDYDNMVKYFMDKLLNIYANEYKKVIEAVNELGKFTMEIGSPTIIKPSSEIVKEKDAKTISESIKNWISWIKTTDPKILEDIKSFEKIMPHIVIENSYAQNIGGRADELSEIVDKTREEVLNTIKKELPDLAKKIGDEKLKELVNKKIGATWDIGHIKMMLSEGYSIEDLQRETLKIKEKIHHLHITENYGDEDSHLIPGQTRDKFWQKQFEALKDKLLEKGVSIVGEFGGWYGNYYQIYGGPYKYNLDISDQVYVPEHYIGYGPNYTPQGYTIYNPAPQIISTPYSPIDYSVFSNLSPDLGGRSPKQTFSGLR